jgi:hypothetical protein
VLVNVGVPFGVLVKVGVAVLVGVTVLVGDAQIISSTVWFEMTGSMGSSPSSPLIFVNEPHVLVCAHHV